MTTKTVSLIICVDLENPDLEKITNDMADDLIGDYVSISDMGE